MNKLSTILGIVVASLGVFSALSAVLFFVIKSQVSEQVSAQLKEAGIVPPAKVEAMEKDIGRNTEDIDDIEDRWNALVDAVAGQQ